MKLPLWRVAEFISAGGDYDAGQEVATYSIDTRTVQPGALFFAIRGERLDGHDFVEEALSKGAVAAVVAHNQLGRFAQNRNLLGVSDPTKSLQLLGAAVRRIWGKQLVAVTGSAGKTTIKEAISIVLATKFRILKSQGNLNNHWGLPLQLLRLEPEHDMAVVEMGMNHSGEIRALCQIARPDTGVISMVGPAHVEFFEEGIAGVARAKYELIESLPRNGVAVLNADDPYVTQFGRNFPGKVVTFGVEHPADVRAEHIRDFGPEGTEFQLVTGGCRETIRLKLIGRHNILNALAAAAIGLMNGIAPSEAAGALSRLAPGDKRGEVIKLAGAVVINDCYNSNPTALDSMVDALAAMKADRHIVVAGEMLELGSFAVDLHHKCGEYMAKKKIDYVVGVRGNAREIVAAAAEGGTWAKFLASPQEAGEWLASELKAGDAILLKASRGVKLEDALEILKAKRG